MNEAIQALAASESMLPEHVDNLAEILAKRDEVEAQVKASPGTPGVVVSAVLKREPCRKCGKDLEVSDAGPVCKKCVDAEVARAIAKLRCPICKRGFNDCNCRLVKEAQPGRPRGRAVPRRGPESSLTLGERADLEHRRSGKSGARRRMQKQSRRRNRG